MQFGAFGLHRRRFLQLAGGAGLAAALPVAGVAAPASDVEALLLICREPGVWTAANNYMKSRKLAGRYETVEIEGAAIGLVAEQYRAWRETFWDALTTTAAWQQGSRIIALNHRGCSALKIAYGVSKSTDALLERETHRYALQEFRRKVAERNPAIEVEIGLVETDGRVRMFN